MLLLCVYMFCNNEADDFCSNNDFNLENSTFPELDVPISVEEVRTAIKHLKRNKSSGSDCMLNEYFLECSDILSAHLLQVLHTVPSVKTLHSSATFSKGPNSAAF